MFYIRKTFFLWFLYISLIFVGIVFLYYQGFASKLLVDKTYISWFILAVAFYTIFQLGFVSWQVDTLLERSKKSTLFIKEELTIGLDNIYNSLEWSSEMVSTLPLLGIIGTVVGFVMQADILLSGTAGLGPLGTSLFSTLFGVGGAVVIRLIRFNIQKMIFSLEKLEK
jgi:hypothetical protein